MDVGTGSGGWIEPTARAAANFLIFVGEERGNRIAQTFLTLIALLVATAGAYIGLRTYTSAARDASNAHMHGLFRDYLRARLDVSMSSTARTAPPLSEPISDQLAALKLYALEEMFTWVRREEHFRRDWLIFGQARAKARADRADFLAAWRKTILVHAIQERAAVLKSFEDYASCYSLSFLRFINDSWACPRLTRLIAEHQQALDAGAPRPAGRLERAGLAGPAPQGGPGSPAGEPADPQTVGRGPDRLV